MHPLEKYAMKQFLTDELIKVAGHPGAEAAKAVPGWFAQFSKANKGAAGMIGGAGAAGGLAGGMLLGKGRRSE